MSTKKIFTAFLLVISSSISSPGSASCIRLEDAYDTAGPRNGYDKYIVLKPYRLYSGPLTIDEGTTCRIVGNGAKLDLHGRFVGGMQILAEGEGTVLDIDRLVIRNGNAAGIQYANGASGTVDHCTIDECYIGVIVGSEADVSIRNCIVTRNTVGIVRDYSGTNYLDISYCDVWGNEAGAYLETPDYCGPYTPFEPEPGDGCFSEDPLYVGTFFFGIYYNYHLRNGSPCIDAADDGSDLGAYE